MSQHFLREIDTLKKKILTVGAVVEERIAQAIDALAKRQGYPEMLRSLQQQREQWR